MVNGSRLGRDEYFIAMAKLVAQRATCLRRAVGCVLTNEHGHVLATGYNGVARGQPHCNEITGWISDPVRITRSNVVKCVDLVDPPTTPVYHHACSGATAPSGTNLQGCQAIHAEQNALLQCRNINEIHTAYVTASPCIACMRLIANTSIRRIVFAEEYPHAESRLIAESRGIVWDQYRPGR